MLSALIVSLVEINRAREELMENAGAYPDKSRGGHLVGDQEFD